MALYYAIACGWGWLAWSPVALGSGGLKLIHWDASISLFLPSERLDHFSAASSLTARNRAIGELFSFSHETLYNGYGC